MAIHLPKLSKELSLKEPGGTSNLEKLSKDNDSQIIAD